jgi:diguanylate cyclase (GGDEF)-like protein/PAS domain S-box-containing protein
MSNDREPTAGTEAAIALQQSEARLRLMIDAVPAMLTYLDTNERYLFSNRSYMEMMGLDREEIVGRSMKEVLGQELYERIRPFREKALAGETVEYERQHLRRDGSMADLSVTFVPQLMATGVVEGFFSLTLDITRLKTLERELAHMARHDALTGLPNRALFNDRLTEALERSKRHLCNFALLYLDIDHFKSINDTRGHATGDELLADFAARLRHCVRAVDTVARLGGDEFVLILEGPMTADGAAAVAQKIVASMRAPFEIDGAAPVSITSSVGIAMPADVAESAQSLTARADAALYEAKANGRDTYVLRLA